MVLSLAQLVDVFGSVRDEWIAEDLHGWLGLNRIYPHVTEAVKALIQRSEVYIVTTKQVGLAVTPGACRAQFR